MPKPVTAERQYDKARRLAHKHPWIGWGAIAGMIAILQFTSPYIASWIGHFQTVEASDKMNEERKKEIDELRKQIKDVERKQAQKDAWFQVGQERTNSLVLRNRVNDCNAKRAEKPKLTGIEDAICKQYQDEYDASARRLEALQRDANSFNRTF